MNDPNAATSTAGGPDSSSSRSSSRPSHDSNPAGSITSSGTAAAAANSSTVMDPSIAEVARREGDVVRAACAWAEMVRQQYDPDNEIVFTSQHVRELYVAVDALRAAETATGPAGPDETPGLMARWMTDMRAQVAEEIAVALDADADDAVSVSAAHWLRDAAATARAHATASAEEG